MTLTDLCAAIETVEYKLSPSAIDALELEVDVACGVYAEALARVYPNADINVYPNKIDADAMSAEGGGALVSERMGRISIVADEATDAWEYDLKSLHQRAWERAIELAAERLRG